ncbi:MAG: hypothetical protein Ta2B_28700 [Termitinemataceae bacterium]|nr:MAG: hypothetical protein Ta2B_28700 [Termitinemataceae bacterium]
MTDQTNTIWKERIISAFVERYPYAAASSGGKNLRISADKIFGSFDKAPPNERESFLEACESLETKGLITIKWEKHKEKEKIKSLVMSDSEVFFSKSGLVSPSDVAKKARDAACAVLCKNNLQGDHLQCINIFRESIPFFEFISGNINAEDAVLGIDEDIIYDAAKLFSFFHDESYFLSTTLRSFSVKLYSDSKRLENLLKRLERLFRRAEKAGIHIPQMPNLCRSFPDTLIAGRIRIFFQNQTIPLENACGNILGLPLETIKKIQGIGLCKTVEQNMKNHKLQVLTIENKETFYVLSSKLDSDGILHLQTNEVPLQFNLLIYCGGHPNNAVSSLVKILSTLDADFFHTGDLDPDGILILQEIADVAGKFVAPIRMDCQTFNQYKNYTRPLESSIISRLNNIREATLKIKCLAELSELIKKTERGLEQEIIDYSSRRV